MGGQVNIDLAAVRGALTTRRLGCELAAYDLIGSTNTEAVRRAAAGAPHGMVVVADAQSHGRGRLGRQWVSPPGCNLYCSIVLRPEMSPAHAPLLTLCAGLATAEAVERWVPKGVRIKWPNDVTIEDRKVGGILTEMEASGGRVVFAVVGIGVNLNAQEEDFPAELRCLATSLRIETGQQVDRARFLAELLNQLELRYEGLMAEGFSSLAPLWAERDGLAGRPVRVSEGETVVEGTALGISREGRLRVDCAGEQREIVAGDVVLVRAAKA